MGEVVEVGKFISCSICHKRQATLLCDMPLGLEKTMHMRLENGLTDYENSFKEFTITCDKPICEKCAVEVNPEIHFCKSCIEGMKGGR